MKDGVPLLSRTTVADEGGSIHAHECDEGSEIQHFGAQAVAHHECANQRDAPTKSTLFRGTRCFASTAPKKDFGKRVAPSHSVEQTGRADLRAHARAEIGDQQGKADDAKHRLPGARRRRERMAVSTSGKGCDAGQINCAA